MGQKRNKAEMTSVLMVSRDQPRENPVAKTTGHNDVIPRPSPPQPTPQSRRSFTGRLGKCLKDAGGIVPYRRGVTTSTRPQHKRGVQLGPRQDRPRSPAHVTHSHHHMPRRDGSGQMNMEIFSVKSHLHFQKRVKIRLDQATGSRNPASKRDFWCSGIPYCVDSLLRSAW